MGKKLLMKGIHVIKYHSGNACTLSSFAKRVLYMDATRHVLIVGKKKGSPANKVYSIHQLVDVVKVSSPQFQLRINSGEKLTLEMETEKAATMMVERLHSLATSVHSEYGNEWKMQPLKRGYGAN